MDDQPVLGGGRGLHSETGPGALVCMPQPFSLPLSHCPTVTLNLVLAPSWSPPKFLTTSHTHPRTHSPRVPQLQPNGTHFCMLALLAGLPLHLQPQCRAQPANHPRGPDVRSGARIRAPGNQGPARLTRIPRRLARLGQRHIQSTQRPVQVRIVGVAAPLVCVVRVEMLNCVCNKSRNHIQMGEAVSPN